MTLPPGGSASPVTATTPTSSAQYGPGIIYTSGPTTVSTQGTTGTGGSVTTSSTIQNVNTSGQEVFTASGISSTCTATGASATGSTTVTNGTLQTSEGDPDVDGDETTVIIPANPAPNTTYQGQIESVGDSFRYVFNEQVVNPDGSIVVNAAHQYLLGPTAVGELIIGRSVCGVTATPSTDDTTPPETTITKARINQRQQKATFAFRSTEVGSSFFCKLDNRAFKECSSPQSYSELKAGRHTFRVRATDAAGNPDLSPAREKFKIEN